MREERDAQALENDVDGFGFEILPWDLQRELFEVSVAHSDGQLEVVEGAGLDLNFVPEVWGLVARGLGFCC